MNICHQDNKIYAKYKAELKLNSYLQNPMSGRWPDKKKAKDNDRP